MLRVLFALKHAFIYAKALHAYCEKKHLSVASLDEITAQRLDKAHVAILVLDFDGVLSPHGDKVPCEKAQAWLKRIALDLGEQRIVILTNKPMRARIDYFNKHFPNIELFRAPRKKPYPDGLVNIALQKGVPSYRLLLVDDRLLTGMLAVELAQAQGLYFRQPLANMRGRVLSELFFRFLRVTEKNLLKFLAFCKGSNS